MPNVLDFIEAGFREKCIVQVTLPGESRSRELFLTHQRAKAKKLEVFFDAFDGRLTSTQRKLAEKLFGSEPEEIDFDVFCDDSMKMVYAYCQEFASFWPNEGVVRYCDPDDVLMALVPEKPDVKPAATKPPATKPPASPQVSLPSSWGDDDSGGVFRYAILEQKP